MSTFGSSDTFIPLLQVLCIHTGIEGMRTATRRYARYQNRWVRTQLFERRNPEFVPPVYSFDSTDKQRYKENVIEPASQLLGKNLMQRLG